MATSSKKPAGPLCCVTIGYLHYLMPMDKGLKLIELMSHAVSCAAEFNTGVIGTQYRIEGGVEVIYESIKPSQVLPPKAEHIEAAHRRGITLDLLKIEMGK